MTEYMSQRACVESGRIASNDDFASISDQSKLIESIINFLHRDMNVVDAMVRQMENFCAQQGIAAISNEAGPAELQRGIDWLRQHFMERASGQ
jgi:hypothetical protein